MEDLRKQMINSMTNIEDKLDMSKNNHGVLILVVIVVWAIFG